MKGDIQFEPVPFEEAARIIRDRPVVEREVFEKMIPEIRARSFLITGLEDAKVGQAIRDAIAELPLGGGWEKIKQQVVTKLQEKGGVPWLDEEGAKKRAEILLRHHGFQAYASAHHEQMAEQVEGFPYWQYLTMGDELVRESHAKLHGLILPANHPFWNDHYPPWDWGCRCQVVPVSQYEYDQTVKEGRVAGKMKLSGLVEKDYATKSRGWALPKAAERHLASTSRLDEGTGSTVDVASPRQRAMRKTEDGAQEAARAAYQWNPGDLRIPVSELHDRYGKAGQEEVFTRFYENMQAALFEDDLGRERSVWEWAFAADMERAAGDLLAGPNARRKELLAVLDHKTGKTVAVESGTADRVPFGEHAILALRDGRAIAMVHNHIEAGGPSPADIGVLFRFGPTVKSIAVAEPGGKVHLVSARIQKNTKNNLRMAKFLDKMMDMADAGKLADDRWNGLLDRLIRSGMVHYESK